jgi:protein TonB
LPTTAASSPGALTDHAASPSGQATPAAETAAPPSAAWRQALAAWIAGHKTYPDAARRQGIEGIVALRFSIDRTGHVTDIVVLRGSGSSILDTAAEAILRNATVPPPDRDRITISVSLHYTLTD